MSSPPLPALPASPPSPGDSSPEPSGAPPPSARGRLLARALAVLVFALPVVLLGQRLVEDLEDSPTIVQQGGPDGPSAPIGPLDAGARHEVQVPEAPSALAGVMLFPATFRTAPRVWFEVCSGERCVRARRHVTDGAPFILPVPAGVRGGALSLTLRRVEGGTFAYWGVEGRPTARGVSEVGWWATLRRARDYFAATGFDLLLPLLGLNALALLGLVGLAVWRALAER